MKIGVLTSSRADYGIYLPLLNQIKEDDFFDLEIIAFGTHLSRNHGFTLNDIKKDGYNNIHKITSIEEDDTEKGISISYAKTVLKFADFWKAKIYDLVFCLGDRFEMSAAVQASIPYGIKLAHIHGGETTLGAIDNIYRHQISLASKIHFVASEPFLKKVKNIIGDSRNIYNVGALSLDGIDKIKIPKWENVRKLYNIPNREFILVTFHPETLNPKQNFIYVKIIFESLIKISEKYHLIITLSNADTMGSLYRKFSRKLKTVKYNHVTLVENFGKYNYFSAIKASKILIGNSSSAILEASSFGKYALNVGDRQLGRLKSDNILDVPYKKSLITDAVNKLVLKGLYNGENKYFKPNPASNIIKIIKKNEF